MISQTPVIISNKITNVTENFTEKESGFPYTWR